jgi:hypothetical protein
LFVEPVTPLLALKLGSRRFAFPGLARNAAFLRRGFSRDRRIRTHFRNHVLNLFTSFGNYSSCRYGRCVTCAHCCLDYRPQQGTHSREKLWSKCGSDTNCHSR